jgi:hypothetical protein
MQEPAVLEEITVNDDDFSLGFYPELESSFGITLPHDLRHVTTVGDLFEEVTQLRDPTGTGDRCDSAMAFHAIRRALSAGQDRRLITPSSRFETLTTETPRALAARLARETGLRMPPLVISGRMLLLAVGLFTATCVLASYGQFGAAIVSAAATVVVWRRQGGVWSGDWGTLGSLSSAVAIRNIAGLSQRGARDRKQDWWRAYISLLVTEACPRVDGKEVPGDRIGPQTRFRWT